MALRFHWPVIRRCNDVSEAESKAETVRTPRGLAESGYDDSSFLTYLLGHLRLPLAERRQVQVHANHLVGMSHEGKLDLVKGFGMQLNYQLFAIGLWHRNAIGFTGQRIASVPIATAPYPWIERPKFTDSPT